MPIAEAQVETERASSYLTHLCRHAAAMGDRDGDGHLQVEWSETHGVIRFGAGGGRCTVDATGTALHVRVEAAAEDDLRRIKEVIGGDLGRFGRRDRLTVKWRRIDPTGG